jgi:hypothetical protein
MAEYTTLSQVVASLPKRPRVSGTHLDAFQVVEDAEPFIEPMMTNYEVAALPQVTFISARGATGKSAMAEELSRRLGAPLWSLGEDKAVSGDALTARLAVFLGVVDPVAEVASGQLSLLIIDAMDEARLRVTGVSWDEFMASLADYVRAGLHLVIFGRNRTIEDVWYSLADAVAEISWYEISHFNEAQQSAYVDLRALNGTAPPEAYVNARHIVLQQLNGATDSLLDAAFAGYAPVLDAVAALLKPGENYQAVINDFQTSAIAGTRLKVLGRILDALLGREQTKVGPFAQQLGVKASDAYTPREQLDWLAADLLGAPTPELEWCPEDKRSEYRERIESFLWDHPFREGDAWASPVFSGYAAFVERDAAESSALIAIAGASGLFFEFAAAEGEEGLVVDEAQFAGLHASLMAGQWVSSTSVVSVRSGTTGDDESASPETATARLVLSQPDETSAVLEATVLLDRAGRLGLTSPLANLDVEFSGSIVVTARSASIDLGPEVFLRAKSIDLAGTSLQVSKDTSAREVAGPTVELEVTESFHTQASLIGNVQRTDFSIVVPRSQKLVYPWVQYRTDPDDEAGDVATGERARRFLNKLMSLARRHGHRGQRAVFIKKLEGRQGFREEEFRRAVATLTRLGVVRESADMLFLADDWDQHRYDGKGREGMVSFEDKREVWEPVIQAITEAIK